MQRSFSHMALVKDEFGVTLGLVNAGGHSGGDRRRDPRRVRFLEELFTVRRLHDGSYEVLGRVSVLDFNRESGWQIPAERGDTVGGLFFNTLGHAPLQGERVALPGFEITVVGVSGSRITRVRIARSDKPAAEEGDNREG